MERKRLKWSEAVLYKQFNCLEDFQEVYDYAKVLVGFTVRGGGKAFCVRRFFTRVYFVWKCVREESFCEGSFLSKASTFEISTMILIKDN